MTEVTLKNRKLNVCKLLSYGFESSDNGYVYCCNLSDVQMKLTVTVTADGKVYTDISDSFGDEYVLHRVADAQGTFVGSVRMWTEAVLDDISDRCFESDVFKTEQAKAVIDYVCEKYGDELEFLWQKFPDNAVWRRNDTAKWYGALMTVSARKLGIESDENIEIIDLRISPEDMKKTIDNKKYYPGYHMNKKHWYTICLDGSVSTEEICRRIDESFLLAK